VFKANTTNVREITRLRDRGELETVIDLVLVRIVGYEQSHD